MPCFSAGLRVSAGIAANFVRAAAYRRSQRAVTAATAPRTAFVLTF